MNENVMRFTKNTIPYFDTSMSQIYLGDTFKLLRNTRRISIDMIFAGPPYFLSNNGITCKSGQMVSVNKADWDKGMLSAKDKHKFNRRWIHACYRVLKINGTSFFNKKAGYILAGLKK